jgi:hypothetical protein
MDTFELKPLGPPLPTAIYPTLAAGIAAAEGHARTNGFDVVTRGSNKDRVYLKCDRGGEYRDRKKKDVSNSRKRSNTATMLRGCPYALRLKRDTDLDNWELMVRDETHNHGPSEEIAAHPKARRAALAPHMDEITRSLNSSTATKTILANLEILQVMRLVVLTSHPRVQLLLGLSHRRDQQSGHF